MAAVIEMFSRRVLGWSMSAMMAAQPVAAALMMAIWRRGKPDALLHHLDRGSQYSSEPFQKLLADHGVTCSMNGPGNVWDNAARESFFSSLETGRTAREVYRTRAKMFDYIERFYNLRRQYSTIRYLAQLSSSGIKRQPEVRVHQTASSSRETEGGAEIGHPQRAVMAAVLQAGVKDVESRRRNDAYLTAIVRNGAWINRRISMG